MTTFGNNQKQFTEYLTVLNGEIRKLQFELTKLKDQVINHSQQVEKLAEASTVLTKTSTLLAEKSDAIANNVGQNRAVNEDIKLQLQNLDKTQKKLLAIYNRAKQRLCARSKSRW